MYPNSQDNNNHDNQNYNDNDNNTSHNNNNKAIQYCIYMMVVCLIQILLLLKQLLQHWQTPTRSQSTRTRTRTRTTQSLSSSSSSPLLLSSSPTTTTPLFSQQESSTFGTSSSTTNTTTTTLLATTTTTPTTTTPFVSIICIAWQTLLDALWCLGHVYLSLSLPFVLFPAFASVAFFQFLICCVIEMKYVSIILQARSAVIGLQPTDALQQVAMFLIRFYILLVLVFCILLHYGRDYYPFWVLFLHSFWVPQIVLNVMTQAKTTPLHQYYVYGMSVTRLVAPLYGLGLCSNFGQEQNQQQHHVNHHQHHLNHHHSDVTTSSEALPLIPYDPITCQWLVLWVALQTAMLIGQGKYGACFWIPTQWLPPKYDYHRPIPLSILHRCNSGRSTTTEADASGSTAAAKGSASTTFKAKDDDDDENDDENDDTSRSTSEQTTLQESLKPPREHEHEPQLQSNDTSISNNSHYITANRIRNRFQRSNHTRRIDKNNINNNNNTCSVHTTQQAPSTTTTTTSATTRTTTTTTTTTTTALSSSSSPLSVVSTSSSTSSLPCSATATATAITPPATAMVLDCSICFETITIESCSPATSSSSPLPSSSSYMLAPCNHIFHRECLLQWMTVKMECPTCRMKLPPV